MLADLKSIQWAMVGLISIELTTRLKARSDPEADAA